MAETTHAAYLQLLEEIKTAIDNLVEVENRKLEAVHSGDLQAVDECIRQEQAVSLTMRSLDQRRDKMLKELGLAGVRLTGLAENFPPDLRRQAAEAAKALHDSYANYNSISAATRMALERGLREIDQMMQPAAGSAATPVARAAVRQEPQLGQQAPPSGDAPHKKLDFGA